MQFVYERVYPSAMSHNITRRALFVCVYTPSYIHPASHPQNCCSAHTFIFPLLLSAAAALTSTTAQQQTHTQFTSDRGGGSLTNTMPSLLPSPPSQTTPLAGCLAGISISIAEQCRRVQHVLSVHLVYAFVWVKLGGAGCFLVV